MGTGNVYFIRHLYQINKALKVYSTYELKQVEKGANQLTKALRIEKFRGFSRGEGFVECLRLRTTSNWKTGELVTGLKFTKNRNIFFGDRIHKGKKHLLLFQFTTDRNRLIIDYFPNYYPAKQHIIQELIKIHFTV